MKKKTILIVTFPQGGPFVWAENLARELRKRGYAVTLASGRKEYLKQQFKYYDIVHSCVPVPNFLCRKYVLTIHGNFLEEKHLSRWLYPLIIKRANFVTVPSEFLKKALVAKKAMIIPNGIDIPENTKNSYGIIGKNPAIGILTNFNFRKKADGTLKLAQIIENISPEVKLVIGGSGEFFEEYKKTILGFHANTEFLGHCKKEDLFDQIDVFTYYSMLDNQPIAVLEAMAFGLPVLSNVVGSVEEVLTGKMEKYIARTDEDYGNKLKKLLDLEEAREENGREARKNSQDFSWDKIAREFVEIYEK
jgi:glycosyltransferase involved in cell wall biosynthesis